MENWKLCRLLCRLLYDDVMCVVLCYYRQLSQTSESPNIVNIDHHTKLWGVEKSRNGIGMYELKL